MKKIWDYSRSYTQKIHVSGIMVQMTRLSVVYQVLRCAEPGNDAAKCDKGTNSQRFIFQEAEGSHNVTVTVTGCIYTSSSTITNILFLIQSLRWICETRRLSSQLIHSQAGNIGVTCIIKDE